MSRTASSSIQMPLNEKAKVEDWLGKHPDVDEESAEMQNAKLMLAKAETRSNVAEGGKRH